MEIEFSSIEKSTIPGETICKNSEDIEIGDGIYISKGFLISSKKGMIRSQKQNSGKMKIFVEAGIKPHNSLRIGDTVLARVDNINPDNAFVKIIAVNSSPLSSYLEGIIKKKDIREKAVDLVKMEECFVPGDIVQAKVGSFGDSRKIQLVTSSENCGVVFAKSLESAEIMLPFSFDQMICPRTKVKESRKVAKPDMNLFKLV